MWCYERKIQSGRAQKKMDKSFRKKNNREVIFGETFVWNPQKKECENWRLRDIHRPKYQGKRDWQPTIDGFQILEEKEAMGQNASKRTK